MFFKSLKQSKIIEELIEEMSYGYSLEYSIEEIIDRLAEIGIPAIQPLKEACKSRSLNCRKYAPVVLGEIWHRTKSKKASLALVEALQYPDADNIAYMVLLQIHDHRIIPALLNIVEKVRPWNQQKIAQLLYEIGKEEQRKK
ncbi:HEAT repeat domain-containing protein [Calditrichota bacterium LG25]